MAGEVWALDDGYGDNKGVAAGKQLLLPTFASRLLTEYKRDDVDSKDAIDPLSFLVVEINGKKWTVGEGARQDDWIGGENKHRDERFPIILKTALGLMAKNAKTRVSTLVMGLPVNADEDPERHELLHKLVVGDHKVKLYFADGRISTKEITIEELVIKKQPVGSVYNVILDKAGNTKDMEFAEQFNVVADIGARTFNIYTMSNLEPVSDLCDNTNDGIYAAHIYLQKLLKQNLGKNVPLGKMRNVIEKGYIGESDISEMIEESYRHLANRIKNILYTMFVDDKDMVDRFIFTGGGSEVLSEYLEDFGQEFFGKEVLFLDRFATAQGLYQFGLRHNRKKTVIIEGEVINDAISEEHQLQGK